MKVHTITLVLVILLMAISCTNSSKNQVNKEGAAIELNNGQKWKVNSEMTPYILEAESILSQYDNGDYEELAERLSGENNSLINSCTMDGKSHDELHKWLLPHMQLVEDLGDAESAKDANKVISELEKSFQTYNSHFQ